MKLRRKLLFSLLEKLHPKVMTIEEMKNFLVPGGTHENTLLQDKEKPTMEKKKTLDEGGEEKWALRLLKETCIPNQVDILIKSTT